MNDSGKTKHQLIKELEDLRKRVDDLEASQDSCEQGTESPNRWLRYRLIAENASDLIALTTFSMNPTYTYVSPSHKTVMGYDPEDLIGKPGFNFIHPEDKKRFLPLLRKYVTLKLKNILPSRERNISETIEYRVRDKSGNWHSMESTVNIMHNELLFISRDISTQKKAVESIKHAYAELMQIFNTTVEGVRVIDKDCNVLLVNETFSKLTGMSEEKMTGKKCYEVFSSHLCHTPDCPLTRIMSGEMRVECDAEIERKDGTRVPCAVFANPFRGTGSETIGIVENLRDITERKKSERELKETKEFLERVIENSKDGILIVDDKGCMLSCNNALEQMSGFGKEEMIGNHASMLVIDDRNMRKRILEKTGELFEKGFTIYEATFKSKEGYFIETECISSMIKNEAGTYIAGVSIIRDITERKRMEQRLLQSEKLKSLEELAGGVAHNFNNILAAILGRAQLLMMNIKTPPGIQERRKTVLDLKKSLAIIEEAALDGANTVRRIQDFSRRRDGDRCSMPVHINDIIEQSLQFTQGRWKDEAESKDIKITINKDSTTLPPIAGNVSELIELFANLINNAIDAMPQGGTIGIKSFAENKQVTVTIGDTGVGIPQTVRDRIFDPFFTTKGEEVIAEQKIKPLLRRHRKVRILVIEDEKDIRELIADILTMNKFEVEVATSGREGVTLFKEKKFDLVFTDLGMPGMSGWQVAKEIKKINDKTPVALITGWQVKSGDAEMKAKGVDLMINKPFKVDQVLRLVQEGIEIRDMHHTKG
jgi:PAS domain S-box-containing protein